MCIVSGYVQYMHVYRFVYRSVHRCVDVIIVSAFNNCTSHEAQQRVNSREEAT